MDSSKNNVHLSATVIGSPGIIPGAGTITISSDIPVVYTDDLNFAKDELVAVVTGNVAVLEMTDAASLSGIIGQSGPTNTRCAS